MADTPKGPDPGLFAALVALGSVNVLVLLTVLGVLTWLPVWASLTIVLTGLLLPLAVLQLMKKLQR